MSTQRKYVASIAGFDPSAGAGVLADLKCFEQNHVYGFGICTALTVQTDNTFMGVDWLDADKIIAQLTPLFKKFDISAVKIGLIKDIKVLEMVLNFIKEFNKNIIIVLDPVLSSSSGFEFHNWNLTKLTGILRQLNLITPNYEEMKSMGNEESAEQTAAQWATHCPVLLKGGHHPQFPGRDQLFEKPDILFPLNPTAVLTYPKHGSGCVLSAAITANLAKGVDLKESCHKAKAYTTTFLNSNPSLLGYHSPGIVNASSENSHYYL
jgi:hydroxymethylpyrimidine/phosphomethylpyrimidine kinase